MLREREPETVDAAPGAGPLTVAERHRLVDALRGVALLGIVVVNVGFIVQPATLGWVEHSGAADLLARGAILTFGELKVYPLFALLFGYGLSVQLDHAAGTGHGIGPRYLRRMLGLAVLGVGHALLFFPGDILTIYAVVGASAYLLRGLGSLRLLAVAASVYAAASAIWLLIGVALLIDGADLAEPASAASLRTLSTGTFAEVVAEHAAEWPATLLLLALVQGPAAFAFTLCGVALGRTRLLTDPVAHRALARRVVRWAAPVGVLAGSLGAVLVILGDRYEAFGLALGFAVAPAMCVAYVAVGVLAWERLPSALSSLAQHAGRMSLSVYLLESVVLSTLAYGYGLGLIGTLSPWQAVLLASGVWVGLALLSAAWLRHARFGPAEWALRSLSYWRIQPLLKDHPAGGGAPTPDHPGRGRISPGP